MSEVNDRISWGDKLRIVACLGVIVLHASVGLRGSISSDRVIWSIGTVLDAYTDCVMMKKVFLRGGLTDNNLKCRVESPRGTEEYYFRRSKICKGFTHRLKATINRQRFAFWIEVDRPHRKLDFYEILAKPFSSMLFFKERCGIRNA